MIPDAAITTDVIAGFPGETEAEFRCSFDFVQEMGLAGGHAFTYSPMAGTAAARMPGQVSLGVRRGRRRAYVQLFERASRAFRASQLGTTGVVLWESSTEAASGEWILSGLTDNYIRVNADASERRWNQMDTVLMQEEAGDRLHGIIVKSG